MGCQQQPADATASFQQAVRDADVELRKGFAAKDAGPVAATYADSAAFFPPNAPAANGPEAIRGVWAQLMSNPGFAVTYARTRVEASHEMGYTTGTYELTMHDAKGQPVKDRGKFIDVWRKQPDGKWMCVADTFNSDLPPAPAAGP